MRGKKKRLFEDIKHTFEDTTLLCKQKHFNELISVLMFTIAFLINVKYLVD